MYHLTRSAILGYNNCMSLEGSYDLSIPWYGFEKTSYGALRHVEGTPEALSFSEWENTSSGDPTDYYFASVSGGEPAGEGANAWDYISNGASVASGYPAISGTWAYNNSGGDIRWTGKNGNYYKLSQVKNNGGYVKSMNYAKNASRLTRGLGNGLTELSVFASGVSTYLAVSNGTDNTSTWVNLGISVGGAALTIFGAPVVVTGAAIGGAVWGIGQLVAGDEINGWIDNNFGY